MGSSGRQPPNPPLDEEDEWEYEYSATDTEVCIRGMLN